MQNKKSAIFALAATAMLLVACGGGNNDEPHSDTSTESSQGTTSSSSSGTGKRRAEMTIERNSIREGMTFLDGAKPTTTYYPVSGEPQDYGNSGSMTIKRDGDSETVYQPDQPLKAGRYSVQNKIFVEGGHTVKCTAEFSVTDGATDVEDATGNVKGVDKSTTEAEMEPYKYMNYPGIDTLGEAGKASGCMPSVGNSRVLVIPVIFANTSFGDATETEYAREIIREAFFAENDKTQPEVDGKIPDTTPWESLRSYYKKASGGKLSISGEVTPVYKYNVDDTTIKGSGLAQTICNEAINAFKRDGGYGGYQLDATQFDSDKDGFIDGVEMIYVTTQKTPSEGGSDLWWNYTTYTSNSANVNSPTGKRIFWSRWDYLTNGYYSGQEYSKYGARLGNKAVDGHTIIHETGHMMGAPDYYSYAEKQEEKYGPAGCVDMMDMNIGDHNAYTKMSFGWATPWVVDYTSNDFEITLPSYTETHKFLIVPAQGAQWNGTPWDEYLLIEYYTPTGVNEMDSTGYPEWLQASSSGDNAYGHGGTYRKPGVQMFHVDTRASSTKGDIVSGKKENVVRDYTDTPRPFETQLNDGKNFESPAQSVHSNTPNGTAGGRTGSLDGKTLQTSPFRELHAIFPGAQNSCDSSSYYSSMGVLANLFGMKEYYEKDGEEYGDKSDSKYGGEYFSPSHNKNWFPNGTKFDNGKEFGWSIELVEQTDDSVKLHFVNNLAE